MVGSRIARGASGGSSPYDLTVASTRAAVAVFACYSQARGIRHPREREGPGEAVIFPIRCVDSVLLHYVVMIPVLHGRTDIPYPVP
jgi:hypothetical protein